MLINRRLKAIQGVYLEDGKFPCANCCALIGVILLSGITGNWAVKYKYEICVTIGPGLLACMMPELIGKKRGYEAPPFEAPL